MTEVLSYRNQSIDLQGKSIDWFLYDGGLRHERELNYEPKIIPIKLTHFIPIFHFF